MATRLDQKDFVKTALRLPPEVHAAVHAAAEKSGRSYNAELVERVQRSLSEDEQAVDRRMLEASLMGVQTMLAFHLREFFDLLPPDVQKKPVNMAVRNLAVAIGHGSKENIETTLARYFLRSDDDGQWFRSVAEALHARRKLLDDEVDSHPNSEPLDATTAHIRAKP